MKIKKILVSQPAPSALDRSPFFEIIDKHSIKVDFHSFIRVEPVSVKEFRSQRVDILAHSAVIFTNRSSVDHFFMICEQTRVNVPESMKYFCVTEAIALYLQKYIVYRKRKIFFGKATFTELMEQVLKHKDEHFLLLLPDSHKPELIKTMDKIKVKYSKVITSHTVSADIDNVDLASYDILVFYSPSEIATLTAKHPAITESPKIATFGNGTAVAAVEAGLTVSILAPTPESPSMVNAIDTYIAKYNAGETLPEIKVEKKSHDISHLKIETKSKKSPAAKSKKSSTKKPAAKPKVSAKQI